MLATVPLVLAISGANEAGVCEWPTVVAYRAGEQCTGVLVHPEVVLTAAHCLLADTVARVRFGERSSLDEFDVAVESCVLHPDLGAVGWGAGDLAVCVLTEPVTDIPPTPVLAGCEAEVLAPGARAVLVGFGGTDGAPEFGIKRYAFTTLASGLKTDGTLDVGDAGVTACVGDSGGPGLVQLADGSWRVFGILSGGSACDGVAATAVALHPQLPWLESVTGRDLTPCHDADGPWSPSAACAGATLHPIDGAATWDDRCASPLSSPSPLCTADDGGNTDGGAATEPAGNSGCSLGSRPALAGWAVVLVGLRRRRWSHRADWSAPKPEGTWALRGLRCPSAPGPPAR